MNMLEAWKHSTTDTASYNCHEMIITVACTNVEKLTVGIGVGPTKQLTPEDLSRLLRFLDIDPEKGWSPV